MSQKSEGPGAGGAARGAKGISRGGNASITSTGRPREVMTARVLPDGLPVVVKGRNAQTLRLLLAVGVRGFTAGEAAPLGWARRTSQYVMNLRRAGFPIATTREPAADGSRVGRYTLAARVEVAPQSTPR